MWTPHLDGPSYGRIPGCHLENVPVGGPVRASRVTDSLKRLIVVCYDEIGLKGRNRSHFEKRLRRALKEAARSVGACQITKHPGRFIVQIGEDTDERRLIVALAAVPGVRYALLGLQAGFELESIRAAILQQLPDSGVKTFGVRARRRNKSFPLTSGALEAELGAFVLEQRPWQVELKNPDLWVRIEVPDDRVLVSLTRVDGSGGLPVGSSGSAVLLLSGGIDSPVAAHAMMTRGLRLTLLHFHSAPFTSRESQAKVRELASILSRHQPRMDLIMVPFADPIQRSIVELTRAPYRVLLYRRFMLRLALRAAEVHGASCLVTGEALGQVASQTIENLTAVEAVSPLPILRPLIGTGKNAIIRRAQALGTYDCSIQPHDDCCSYLMPREPATRSTAAELDTAEEPLDVERLVEEAWSKRVVEYIQLAQDSSRRALPTSEAPLP